MGDEYDNPDPELQRTIEELVRRIDDLSQRIEWLEHLDPDSSPKPQHKTPAPSASQPAIVCPSREEKPSLADRTVTRQLAIKKLHAPTGKVSKPPKPKREKPDWMSGTKGLIVAISLVGVLILIVGVGFFLKMAIDKGWIAAIPPEIRCGGSALLGALLVGAGELVRRKISPIASAGASAAGIAIIYASILAAEQMYGLLSTPVAFGLLVATSVLGIWLGSISQRVTLALLSLVGAFLVPVFLRTGEPSYVVMPTYLVSLLAIGLVLAGWRGGVYSYARKLAWWGTGILGTLWLTEMHDDSATSSIVFVSTVWVATVVELIASSRFFGTLRDNTPWTDGARAGFLVDESGEKLFDPRALLSPEARWINALFGVSIWAVVSCAITLRAINEDLDFYAPLGFAIASALLGSIALRFRNNVDSGLWARIATPRSALAAALVINGIMLVCATIASALGGWMQVVAWLCVGFAAIETSRRIRFRASGILGIVLLGVAIVRLVFFDFGWHLQHDPSHGFLGLVFTDWSAQMVLGAGVLVLGCWRSRYHPEGSVLGCVALWVIAFSLVHTDGSLDAFGPALMIIALIGAWATAFWKIMGLRVNAYILAALATWFTLAGQLDLENGLRLTHAFFWIPPAIAGACWIALAAFPRALFSTRAIFALMALVCGLVSIAVVYDTYGAPQMVVAWALFIALVAGIGFRFWRWSVMEIAGVTICVLTLAWAAQQIEQGSDGLEGMPIVHAGFGAAIITTLVAIVIGRALPRLPKSHDAPEDLDLIRKQISKISFGVAWLLLLACSSVEAERIARSMFAEGAVRGAAVSIWWSLYAVGSVALGFRLHAMLRWAGLALLGVVAIKVLAFDTVVLDPAARVVAAITVGLIIIGAGVLYAWLASKTSTEPESVEDQSSS